MKTSKSVSAAASHYRRNAYESKYANKYQPTKTQANTLDIKPPIVIKNGMGYDEEDIVWDIDDEEKTKKDARNTVARLRYIQLGLCLVLLGGYVRLTATGMNIFSPQTLDDAFDADIDIQGSHLIASLFLEMGRQWPLTLLLVGSAVCMALDFVYYWAITTKDKCELEEKIADLEAAKRGKTEQDAADAIKINTILERTKEQTKINLKKEHEKIIKIIEEDVLIQELLIRSDIDRQRLLEKLRAAGASADIAAILEQLSIDVSLKDYQSSHKDFQQYARGIEYVQAIKIPLRYTSLLLLLNHKAFEYPDIASWTGMSPIQEGEPVYEWIIIGSAFLLALTVYAFHLEFKKNDNNTELDKKTRLLKNKHHEALLSTLLLALNRKLDSNEGSIVSADPTKAIPEEKLFGISFNSALWLKVVISILCLGSLGRRPFTVFGLSGEENAPDSTFGTLLGFVAVFVIVDIIYISLSLIEERWELNNKKDKNRVLDACSQHAKDLAWADNNKDLNDDEALLANELKKSEQSTTSRFEKDHPTLHYVKRMTEQLLCIKFGLRALSVAWALIQIRATDTFKQKHMGDMSASDATMLFAFGVGFMLGILAQCLNNKKNDVLNTNDKTRQYTKNTLLFFRDEKDTQLVRRPECTVRWHR